MMEENKTPEVSTEEQEESTIFSDPTVVTNTKKVKAKSKKTWILILVILIVAAVLGLGIYGINHWIPSKQETSSSEESTSSLPAIVSKSKDGSIDVISSVTIKNDEGTYTISKNKDGQMAVESFEGLPQATSNIETLLQNFIEIVPSKIVSEKATKEQLTAAGLIDSTYEVSITYTDNTTYAFCLGNLESAEAEGYYLCEKGKSTIYLVVADLFQAIDTPANSLLSTKLVNTPEPSKDDKSGVAKVEKMVLGGSIRPQPITMRYITDQDSSSVRLAGNMVITEPYYRGIDTEKTQEWDSTLVALNASGVAKVHPTAEELSSFGLSPARSTSDFTVSIRKTTDNEGNDLEKPQIYNTVTYSISLGNKNEEGFYYAMVQDVDIVYLVTADSVPWAELLYDDLVNDNLFLRYITDVSDITLTIDGIDSTIHLKHGKGEDSDGSEVATLEASTGNKVYDTDKIRSLYSAMMMIQRLAAAPADVIETGTPALTIKLTPLNASDTDRTDFSFYPYSANRYLCFASDGDCYLVKAADIEGFIKQANELL